MDIQDQLNVNSILFNKKTPKISVILIDWSARESFHSLDYLNKQTANRSDYELIWIEMYDTIPAKLKEKVTEYESKNLNVLDQWITLGLPDEYYYHKHFAYNVGIAVAQGDICVICDSDAMFPDNFIEIIIATFNNNQKIVLHIDQIRNNSKEFYPFNYPDFNTILNHNQNINWIKTTTTGLNDSKDILHEANYGACMAARKEDLLAIGGADEHIDYIGYICGPYELTFRLVNFGCKEVWLKDIFLAHTWHPNEGGNNNHAGPSDGRGISLRALEVKNSKQVMPFVANSIIKSITMSKKNYDKEIIISAFNFVNIDTWYKTNNKNIIKLKVPVLVESDVLGNNIIFFDGKYYVFPQSAGAFLTENVNNGNYSNLISHSDLNSLLMAFGHSESLKTKKINLNIKLRRILKSNLLKLKKVLN